MRRRSATFQRHKAVMFIEHEYVIGEAGKRAIESQDELILPEEVDKPSTDRNILEELLLAAKHGNNNKYIKFWNNIIRLQIKFEIKTLDDKDLKFLKASDIHQSELPHILQTFFEEVISAY